MESDLNVNPRSHENDQQAEIWFLKPEITVSQSGGWGLVLTHCCPTFRRFQRTWKEFNLRTDCLGTSEKIKPLQPVDQAAEFKFESKFEPLAVNHSWRLFQKTVKLVGFDCKIHGRALGVALLPCARAGAAWAGRTGEHKYKTFPSRRQSLWAATGSLEENVLPLLRYWLSWRVKGLLLCKFRAVTSPFFLTCDMKFMVELARSCCRPTPRSSLRSIFRSLLGL